MLIIKNHVSVCPPFTHDTGW